MKPTVPKLFLFEKRVQFLIAITITLIIGKVIATIPLFSNTEIFRTLTSAELVSFLTKIAVLVFVFIFIKHALNALDATGKGVSFLRGIAVPVESLIIVAVARKA